ncbi:MAG: CDP-diacylglycerol--serine O-phosphatidyltransferase [Candidatus Marinimicrobia bacterium]|nr:CDP-diacylglycerol--serine O-phosphatidyltransferase [Candidatus Neomarinimicrobiota bacterium]MBL7022909.1 CDP-diacylglycerol--serine O-phosphatidyltransferase [Candidatus Neomarinimicrobiota bacterium]MBL7109228.1 CDP-diacylglycerol--serine O-phosphatidyltransferase [Candidatus Neomarinimicrobiota bacterium]
MKIRSHIPSLFTLINLFLGFLAVLNALAGDYIIACYLILVAAVFDSFDGKLARLFGLSSSFGTEIDSLADMVSFCLAPSVLIYALYTKDFPGITGELIASAPLIMGAIRLAKFNVSQMGNPTSFFTGLPTPMSALAISALVLFTENIKSINPEYTQPKLLLPIIFTISFLMVSSVKYAKFPLLNVKSGRTNNIRLIGVLLFLISFGVSVFYQWESRILMGFLTFYIVSGILRALIKPVNNLEETESN